MSGAHALAPSAAHDRATCPHSAPHPWRNRVFALDRLCKPPLNPLSHDVRVGILRGLQQAQGDDAVSLVVITGGSKAFSAGADIKEMADGHAVRRTPDLLAVVAAIEACRVPVVAAIGGVALGGGCEVRAHTHCAVACRCSSLPPTRVQKPHARRAQEAQPLVLVAFIYIIIRGVRSNFVEAKLSILWLALISTSL